MARRQPEGIIKDECRKDHADPNGLLFWQIEGKSRNGIPDTVAEKVGAGVIFIEFKVPGKEPNEQQWLRIHELREAGQEAWWCDSVDGYRRLVGLLPGGYEIVYPPSILALIAKGTRADEVGKPKAPRKRRAATRNDDDTYRRFCDIIMGSGKRPSVGTGQ